ncbi:MAG TPA: prepilin-type N-terminal cleavage/methylation domain-containing protein [Holophaga sp.]|nr:prepilin-type N-terminal cleavage/methylation domain-containing protein [Holophaga sp.]
MNKNNHKNEKGFSLMELLVAMMIIAVLATIGIKQFKQFSANARYIKAQDTVKTVREGLDMYYLKHGKYPEFTSFEAMVEANSVLVKENMIPVGVANQDPWQNPFEAKSGKGTYEIKCAGDPDGSPDRPPFSAEPGKISGGGNPAAPTGGPADAKGAGK